MDCYDAKWCPDGECDLCDFWMAHGVGPWEARWLRVRRFFVRLWRRDRSAGYVNLTRFTVAAEIEEPAPAGHAVDCPCCTSASAPGAAPENKETP